MKQDTQVEAVTGGPEGEQSAYVRWHLRNSHALNESRRSRYATDPEYRAAQIEAARETRRKQREDDTPPTTVTRYIDGVAHQVYLITDVAKLTGLSRQGLLKWEKRGLIPSPSLPGVHRLYTVKQAQMIVDAIKTLTSLKQHSPERKQAFIDQSAKLHNEWSN